jgi:hypothetical protein
VGAANITSEQIYAETYRRFEEDFRQFLTIASNKDSSVREDEKRRYLDMLYSVADTFEVLTTMGREVKPKGGLACPFSQKGLEHYIRRYGFTGEQSEDISGFLDELGTKVDGDLMEHIRAKIKLDCDGCWVHEPGRCSTDH